LVELEEMRNKNEALEAKCSKMELDIKTLNGKLLGYKEKVRELHNNNKLLQNLNEKLKAKERFSKEYNDKLKKVINDNQRKAEENKSLGDNLFSKLQMGIDNSVKKDREIAKLKKKKNELECKIAQMGSKLHELGKQDKSIEEVAKELEFYKNQPTSARASLLQNENGEAQYHKRKYEESQQTNNLCADLVRD